MTEDPRSATTTGFHLFLEPSGALGEGLAAQIRQLAARHDGPVFPPHVTLLGSIEGYSEDDVVARTTALARTTAA